MRPMSTTKSDQEMKGDQEKMRWMSWFGIDCSVFVRFYTGDMKGHRGERKLTKRRVKTRLDCQAWNLQGGGVG